MCIRDSAERNNEIPSPGEGELAITAGVLQIYDSSWANVSSGGGGGGGAEVLAQLDDVPSAPLTEHHVGVVNGSSQLVFQKLTIDNIDSTALYSGSDFGDDNNHLMTAQAIKNKIEDYGYLTGGNFVPSTAFTGESGIMRSDGGGSYSMITDNSSRWDEAWGWGDHGDEGYAKNNTGVQSGSLTEDVIIPSGGYTNQKYVMMGDPDGNVFLFSDAAQDFTDGTIIEIINHSDYSQIISTGGAYPMYLTNTQSQGTADIVIEKGQRALILPKPANNLFFISILVA